VPPGVPAQDAAIATIASIALHALRLAEVGPGSKVVVVGLGLIGQLAARLAAAAGCDVAGIDVADAALTAATSSGVLALKEQGQATTDRVLQWSRGRGADAVLLCAAGTSSDPVIRTPELCRDRAQVVVVGDIGLRLTRAPFYERELSLRFARSYGPGRYERSYEDWGVDLPAGQVRWTEGRNLEAVLDLVAAGRLRVDDLVTHTFPIAEADAAYTLIEKRNEPYLAISIGYPSEPAPDRPIAITPRQHTATAPGIGWIGAGAFSTGTLLPAFRAAGFDRYVAVASASGVSARRVAERHGFEKAVSGANAVINDPDVEVIVVATPHDTHAETVVSALKAGKHVWCEKPLALAVEELDAVEEAWQASGRQLAVGFNRRWSPAVQAARTALEGWAAPRMVVYRVAAGQAPAKHWYHDRRRGGRLLGEVCHFVDTAQALVGADIDTVSAVAGGRCSELLTSDDVAVTLRFVDGSLAVIAYSSAVTSSGKEHVEILAADRRVVIDDFRSVEADGKAVWNGKQDKGHRALTSAFRRSLQSPDPEATVAMLTIMRSTLAAAGSVSTSE
jgi:predicted dehydrogenase